MIFHVLREVAHDPTLPYWTPAGLTEVRPRR